MERQICVLFTHAYFLWTNINARAHTHTQTHESRMCKLFSSIYAKNCSCDSIVHCCAFFLVLFFLLKSLCTIWLPYKYNLLIFPLTNSWKSKWIEKNVLLENRYTNFKLFRIPMSHKGLNEINSMEHNQNAIWS